MPKMVSMVLLTAEGTVQPSIGMLLLATSPTKAKTTKVAIPTGTHTTNTITGPRKVSSTLETA